jgi:hypothetical protein
LIRAFSAFLVATLLTWTSSFFIFQNFMNWTSIRFLSISRFFWSFAIMTWFAFFFVNLKLFDEARNRLRKSVLLFNSFARRWRYICSFVLSTKVLTIIAEIFLWKFWNFWASVESFHCVFLAILRSQRWKSCLISATSSSQLSWRSRDNVSSLIDDELRLNFFINLMYKSALTDHMSQFSKTWWMMIDLKMLFLILMRSPKNWINKYSTKDFVMTSLMITSCHCLKNRKISTFNDCMQWVKCEMNENHRMWFSLIKLMNSEIDEIHDYS